MPAWLAAIPGIISAGGALADILGLSGEKEQRLPDLSGISTAGIPGQEDFFRNIMGATEVMNPIRSALTANAARAIQAREGAQRRALAGSLGSGVGTAATARIGQIGQAATAEAAGRVAGQVAQAVPNIASQATQFEQQGEIERIRLELEKALGPFRATQRWQFEEPSKLGTLIEALGSLDFESLFGGLFGDGGKEGGGQTPGTGYDMDWLRRMGYLD